MLGAASGLFESLQRMTGAFCKLAAELGRIELSSEALRKGHVDPMLFAKSIATAYGNVAMRPYTGAREGGIVGFGKGLLSFTLGFVTVKIALALGSLSLGLAAAAKASDRMQWRTAEAAKKKKAHAPGMPTRRRQREFGAHGQLLPTSDDPLDAADAPRAARLILKRWIEFTRRRGATRRARAHLAPVVAHGHAEHRALGALGGEGPRGSLEKVLSLRQVIRHAAHQRKARKAADKRAMRGAWLSFLGACRPRPKAPQGQRLSTSARAAVAPKKVKV